MQRVIEKVIQIFQASFSSQNVRNCKQKEKKKQINKSMLNAICISLAFSHSIKPTLYHSRWLRFFDYISISKHYCLSVSK